MNLSCGATDTTVLDVWSNGILSFTSAWQLSCFIPNTSAHVLVGYLTVIDKAEALLNELCWLHVKLNKSYVRIKKLKEIRQTHFNNGNNGQHTASMLFYDSKFLKRTEVE